MSESKGPRWIGDNLPDLPATLQYAQALPPKVTDTHVLFFGFEGPEPECCLQQWHPSPFSSEDGKKFGTSEQYMMYHKSLVMGDQETAERILAAQTPGEAKALGREVKGFDEAKWMGNCDRIVEEGQYLKFSQNLDMGMVLRDTGEKLIVETSPNARFWGVGFNSEEALEHEDEWGENRLGKAIMRARERLRKENT